MAAKNDGKTIFRKHRQLTLWIHWGSKFQNFSMSHHFRDKCVFASYAEIQDGCQKCGKTIFGIFYQLTLRIPLG